VLFEAIVRERERGQETRRREGFRREVERKKVGIGGERRSEEGGGDERGWEKNRDVRRVRVRGNLLECAM
jgi:hypothetical protein